MLGTLVNGAAFGALLFILASGFSLSLGVLRVINIAHGAFYLLSVYLGITVARATGSFVAALAADGCAVMVIAGLLYRGVLARFHTDPLPQVLSTYGVTLIIVQAVRLLWGGYPEVMATPGSLAGVAHVLGTVVPTYRLFLLGVAGALAVVLWWGVERTRIGALVRASVDDEEMARGLGIDVDRLGVGLFAASGLLVGLGSALGAPLLGGYQGVEWEILTLTLVVVVLGGVGSLGGVLISGLVVGVLWNVGVAYFAQYAYFVLFAPMILVLSLRPRGLFGKRLAAGE